MTDAADALRESVPCPRALRSALAISWITLPRLPTTGTTSQPLLAGKAFSKEASSSVRRMERAIERSFLSGDSALAKATAKEDFPPP